MFFAVRNQHFTSIVFTCSGQLCVSLKYYLFYYMKVRINTTAKIKISATSEIVQTLAIYSKGLQYCLNEGWSRDIKNNFKLHPFVYKHLRSLGLHSQLAIACIKQSCGMLKKAINKPVIKQCSMRYNFPRSASLKNGALSLATVKGRVKIPFSIPGCFKEYFSWDLDESLLRMDRQGRCFFLFCFSKEVAIANVHSQGRVLGIDLGVNKVAVTSARTFYGKNIKKLRVNHDLLVSSLQAKGTRACKRKLKALSGKWQRFMAWTNHNISKGIVREMNRGDAIVLEDLTGIRTRARNEWVHKWAFRQLQSFIDYKAVRKGVRVAYCNPAYTSKECAICHERNTSRHGGFLHCNTCNHSVNADLNASRNIAERYKRNFGGAVVNQPILTCNETVSVVPFLVEHSQKLCNLIVG